MLLGWIALSFDSVFRTISFDVVGAVLVFWLRLLFDFQEKNPLVPDYVYSNFKLVDSQECDNWIIYETDS